MPSGPNLELYSVFTNILRAEDIKIKNMEILRHMGVGDIHNIETHADRPRYFWTLGHWE